MTLNVNGDDYYYYICSFCVRCAIYLKGFDDLSSISGRKASKVLLASINAIVVEAFSSRDGGVEEREEVRVSEDTVEELTRRLSQGCLIDGVADIKLF